MAVLINPTIANFEILVSFGLNTCFRARRSRYRYGG
jgi:hypothetical protein